MGIYKMSLIKRLLFRCDICKKEQTELIEPGVYLNDKDDKDYCEECFEKKYGKLYRKIRDSEKKDV